MALAQCDVQELLDANPCYGALNPLDLDMIKTGLLCRILERTQGGALPDCDLQDILTETKCYRSLYPYQITVVQAELILQIAGFVGVPMPNGCLAALPPQLLQVVIAALLCQIAAIIDGADPMVDCSIQALLQSGKCYTMLSPFMLSRLQVSILCTIAETIPPVPPTPPTCQLTITTQPSGYTGDEGTDFDLTVGWSGAFGAATVQWQLDGVDVVDGGNVSGAHTPTLTVTNATAADAGSYTAIVTDPAVAACTATSNPAVVTLNVPLGNSLLTGLLAYYRFEEPSGNALDSSGAGHTLVQHASPATDTGIVEACRAYDHDQHQYFSNSSSAFNFVAAPFSVTCWAQFNPVFPEVNDFTLVAKGSYTGLTLAWWLLLDHGHPDDLMSFYYTTDGVTLQVLSVTVPGGVNENIFYFVALRWDGTTLRLSITGEDEGSVAAGQSVAFAGPFYSTSDPLLVGDMTDDNLHAMDGRIDELGVWSGSLSDCAVAYLFTAKDGAFTYTDFNAGACT